MLSLDDFNFPNKQNAVEAKPTFLPNNPNSEIKNLPNIMSKRFLFFSTYIDSFFFCRT